MTTRLRTDLLPEIEVPLEIRARAENQYMDIVRSLPQMTTSPFPSKNINQTMELIREAIVNYMEREGSTEDARINVMFSNTDVPMDVESISITLLSRLPGSFEKSTVMDVMSPSKTRTMKPVLREEGEDPDAPGYRRAILGCFYDNIIELTAWARTAKTANDRALWLEDLMEEYQYFFKLSGVNRLMFAERGTDQSLNVNGNIIHGRPLRFYVRTEKIRAVRQKTLEQIYIHVSVNNGVN